MSPLRLIVSGFLHVSATIVLRLLVVWVYWQWFFIPLGAPLISLPQAVGLILFAEFITMTIRPINDVTEPPAIYVSRLKKETDRTLVGVIWTLGLGWPLHFIS